MHLSVSLGIKPGEKISGAASRLISSGARNQALLDDLLDFNRTKLGLGLDIAPVSVDLAKVFEDELERCERHIQIDGLN